MFEARDVCEEKPFEEELDRLRKEFPRIDNVWEGICWQLARNPNVGKALDSDPDFRVFTTTSMGTTPAFNVLYSHNEHKVHLWAIEPVIEEENNTF